MNKLRKPPSGFTMVPNALIRSATLSLKAKGLYSLLFAKPDNWTYVEEALLKESADGRESFRSGIVELVQFGWLTKVQVRDDKGVFSHIEWCLSVDGKPVDGLPVDGEPAAGKSPTNNTDLNNTDGIIPPVSPKTTKASSRANPSQRLSEHLAASGGIPPVEWGEWAHTTFGWDADRISFEWDDFSDYWNSGNAKGGGRKSDWAATWRSHCRRQSSDSRRGYRAGGKARSGFATAFASSVADQYGVPSAGGGVGGGNAAEGARENPRARADRLPNGEIPF